MYLSSIKELASLPPVPQNSAEKDAFSKGCGNWGDKLVVLDDDPTGTQTVHDVPVLTTWGFKELRAEFDGPLPCFYVLTKSRSLEPEAARRLTLELAANLKTAASGRPFTVISRSDSTLRGHFPLETDTLEEVLGPFQATILIPYFDAGQRYTVDDIHYVAEGDDLTPVADTPFARDPTFGYSHGSRKCRRYTCTPFGNRQRLISP